MRNRDKMKDDAIAQLSDQLMALTAKCRKLKGGSSHISINSEVVMICLAKKNSL